MTRRASTIQDCEPNHFTVRELVAFLCRLPDEEQDLPVETDQHVLRQRNRADLDVDVREDQYGRRYLLLTVSREPV
jgi:hypothetical protein